MPDEKTVTAAETAGNPGAPGAQGTDGVPTAPPQAPPAQTQPEINNIVARESRKAVEKLLKDAGIMPGDNPEMQLKEYKKWLDGQKSDLEKAQGDVTAVTAERDAALAEAETLKQKFAVVAKGVPADRADDYIALANARVTDGVTFEQALDKALETFPFEQKQTPPPYAPTGDAPLFGAGGMAGTQSDLNKHRITK